MSESTPINIQAFLPFAGGVGKRLTVTTVTSNGAIPGTQGSPNKGKLRILVSNGGAYPASVRLGQEGVVATLDCLEILPDTQVLLMPPDTNPSGLWIAAICEGGTTSIQATAGEGT